VNLGARAPLPPRTSAPVVHISEVFGIFNSGCINGIKRHFVHSQVSLSMQLYTTVYTTGQRRLEYSENELTRKRVNLRGNWSRDRHLLT